MQHLVVMEATASAPSRRRGQGLRIRHCAHRWWHHTTGFPKGHVAGPPPKPQAPAVAFAMAFALSLLCQCPVNALSFLMFTTQSKPRHFVGPQWPPRPPQAYATHALQRVLLTPALQRRRRPAGSAFRASGQRWRPSRSAVVSRAATSAVQAESPPSRAHPCTMWRLSASTRHRRGRDLGSPRHRRWEAAATTANRCALFAHSRSHTQARRRSRWPTASGQSASNGRRPEYRWWHTASSWRPIGEKYHAAGSSRPILGGTSTTNRGGK